MTVHSSKIDIAFGKLEELLDWCYANCRDQWTFSILEDAGQEPGRYRFFFDSETDRINFILWKA